MNWKKISLAVVATLGSLLLGELIVRGFAQVPRAKSIQLASPDCVYKRSSNPLLGFELKSDYQHADPDFIDSYEQTNSHGQRDVERTLAKPPGVRRILLLGDSVVEGYGLPQDATISHQLQSMYPEGTTEVLNFGISAYCTLAEIELLATKGVKFAPDIVVLVFVENDFDNFNREAFPLGGTIQRPPLVDWMFSRSHFFRLVCLQGNWFQFRAEVEPIQWNREAMGDNNVAQGLVRLRELARQYDVQPLVAIWPKFLDDRIVDVHFMPGNEQLIVEALAQQNGLPSHRLSADFAADYASHPRENARLYYSQGDALHPSRRGARVAAEALYAALAIASDHEFPGDKMSVEAEAAIAAAAKLGHAKPNYARVYNRQGNDLYKQGKYEEAIQEYERALQEDAAHAATHNNLGLALEALGRTEEAKQHFIRAVEAEPDFAWAHFNLSRVLLAAGQRKAALHGFRRTLQLDPQHIGANYRLGTELAKQRQFDEARPYLERTLTLNDRHAQAHNDLGVILAAQGHHAEAIEHFQTVLRLQPDHPRAAQNLANTRELQQRPDQ